MKPSFYMSIDKRCDAAQTSAAQGRKPTMRIKHLTAQAITTFIGGKTLPYK